MDRLKKDILQWGLIFLLAHLLAGCTNLEAEEPKEQTSSSQKAWQAPGLVDRTGQPIEIRTPAPATGKTLDVIEFGANISPDSMDDAEAIRKAIAIANQGDEVYLPAGIYDLRTADSEHSSTNILLKSGVHIRGAGKERTILITSFDGIENSSVIRGNGVTDVVISDLTITSRYEGVLGSDTKDFENGGGPMYGIFLGADAGKGSSNVLVKNVSIRRFARHGISIKASREVTLSDNYISEATSIGPGGKGYGIAIEALANQQNVKEDNDSRHNVVVGNTIDGTHLRHGILLQFSTHNNLIANNIIIGSHLDAIDLHGEGEYLNEIRDNIVVGSRRAAIALGNSGGTKHKHDASGHGNWIHRNRLIGNEVGILVILGTPNTLIENNLITAQKGSEAGIEIRNGPNTSAIGNYITGKSDDFWAIKVMKDSGTEGRGKGIPTNVQIEGNIIRQTTNGLKINAGENINMIGNIIEDIEKTKLHIDNEVKNLN